MTQFFKIHFGLFQKCYSYKRHKSDTSPATFPHCDMMYEKRNPANWIFLVWRRRGGECAVMKQADRLYHVTSPVGARPPNKSLHCNNPHNVKIFCKIKRREDGRVATCNGALDEISARMGSVAELAGNIISSTGYVPLVPYGTAGCGALQA